MSGLRRKISPLVLMGLLVSQSILATSMVEAATIGRQAIATSILRVCADPDNLPFSSRSLEGFENRIIAVLAEHLGLQARYTWYPTTTGFVRNTLRLRQCDVISGITTTSELVQNTNPYYHSTYTMVYRRDSGIDATTMSDPALKALTLGVVAGTPPANVLAQRGLMNRVKPYQLVADTRRDKPAQQAMQDVDRGVTDVAFIWGPIAAWHAKQARNTLQIVPLVDENPRVRMDFTVSMAVRHNETDWKHTVNEALVAVKPEIDRILAEYGVPLVDERGRIRAD